MMLVEGIFPGPGPPASATGFDDMARIDLTPFGFEAEIELEGAVVEVSARTGTELVFLLDENHSYLAGIHQSLRNAIKLIDAGIVDFVGVEGFSGDLKPIVEQEWRKLGFPTLAEARRHFATWRVPEKAIINLGQSFARLIALLRAHIPVYGIEDPAAYEQAGKAIRSWETTFPQRAAKTLLQILKANGCLPGSSGEPGTSCSVSPAVLESLVQQTTRETMDFIKVKVQAERPHYFVANLLHHRQETGAKRASIINAGRMDQDAVSDLLRSNDRFSFIRVRPRGFPPQRQTLEGFWRFRLQSP